MAETPQPERTSSVSAGSQRIRTGLNRAGVATSHALARLRHPRRSSETAEAPQDEQGAEPAAEPSSVAVDVQRIRTAVADAGGAAGRTLARANWAGVILVALVQVGIAFIAWRVSVWRSRRRRARDRH